MLLACSMACGFYYCTIRKTHTPTHNIINKIIMYHNNGNSSSSSSSDQHQHVPIDMNPRISFSNDFVESSYNSRLMNMHHEPPSPLPPPPVSSDFEFSVSSYSMMSADELFSKGRLLPYKNNQPLQKTVSTLREELLTSTEDDDGASTTVSNSMRPPKAGGRWKGLLGLRKSSKKADINTSSSSSLHRSAFLPHDHPHNFNGNSE